MNPLPFSTRRATSGNRILRAFHLGFRLALIALFTGTAAGAVDATLTPATTSSATLTPVVLQVTGLATGESVIIERILDVNADGIVDAGEPLAGTFAVTDGQVPTIGGVRNTNMPGDEDITANGQMSIHLNLAFGSELGRLAGVQIIRVSSPATAFAAFTRTLTLTQPAQAQSINGTVTDGTNPVPYASVVLLDATTDGDFALGVVANAAGQFTVNAPVGSYMMFAIMADYVANLDTAPVIALGAGGTPTQNLQLAPATTFISGTIANATTSAGLGGVQMFVQSGGGLVTLASSNADGTYSIPVTADQWQIEISENSVTQLGYLRLQDEQDVVADTTGAAATGVNINLLQATALIHGTVTDSGANPLAGIPLRANDSSQTYESDATTDANGQYVLGAAAGDWNVSISEESPAVAGYVIPNGQSVEITGAQAVQIDFSMLAVNAHLQGVVTNTGTPVSGIRLGAYNQSTNQFVMADTAPDGTFDLGLVAGTWMVQIESSSAAAFNIVSPSVVHTLGENQTISGITIAVLTASARITGTVTGTGGAPLDNLGVYANATIGGTDYNQSVTTDASGQFSIGVINGTWLVGVDNSGLNSRGYGSLDGQSVIISGADGVANFVASAFTGLQNWRQTFFGTPDNSGDGENLNDFDKDGIANLVEFAFGMNPLQNSAGLLPQAQRIGNNLVTGFSAPGGISGITYGAEWSTTLQSGSWTPVPDTGTPPQHIFSVPQGTNSALFMRLKVTSP